MELEKEREVIFLKNSLPPVSEESESSLVLKRAINLCEDLDDDEAEGSDDHADLNESLASIKLRGKNTNTLSLRLGGVLD